MLTTTARLAFLLIVTALLHAGGLSAQNARAPETQIGPGGMQLLPGYQHERLRGLDTLRGRIWKDGGPNITYEIGPSATNEVQAYKQSNRTRWVKAIKINNAVVEIALHQDNETLLAASPDLCTFRASPVKSYSDMADVLLMITTYDPLKGLKGQ
jgi:hypothetical protein